MTIARAALRDTFAISRSRLRTPASRVYSRIIRRSAASEMLTRLASNPFSASWRGTR